MENSDLLQKVQQANSVEELSTFAKKNHLEVSEEEINAYYNRFHKTGEMTDNELNNVSGGGCHKTDGRLIVSIWHYCDGFKCGMCKSDRFETHSTKPFVVGSFSRICSRCGATVECKYCAYMTYEKGLWLCNHPANKNK